MGHSITTKAENVPKVQPNRYLQAWYQRYKSNAPDIGKIFQDEALPSLAKICEVRDCPDTPAQTALQASMAILNKVVPDKIERTDLTVSLDLTRLIEAYQGINRPLSTDPQVIDSTEDLK